MTTECIHGLDIARCDVCSPRTPPPQDRTVKPRRAPARTRPATVSATKPVAVDAGTRRIFHITHRRNLAPILEAGRVLSDAAGASPAVDISAADNRELRREVLVGSEPVAAHVPFFLAPNAILWDGMRNGEADYRLAEGVGSIPASDFVILVSTVRAAGESAVVADGDAADPTTRFSSLTELGGRMPRRLHDEEDALRSAEFLVPGEFSFAAITLVGVANDKVRAEVRTLLEEHGFAQKVSVYPPWFQRV
ncbi:MAG TPA: DUF4433 domain-containing protein [Terrimesophilobacter sp.]|nr:DUF4433 domain-containing protein [Terrimesophilobacter sp.]